MLAQQHQHHASIPTSGVNYPVVPTSTTGRILPTVAISSPSPAASASNPFTSAPPPSIPTTTAHDHQSYNTVGPADDEVGEYDGWEGSSAAGDGQYPVRSGRPLSDVVEVDEDQRSRVSEMSHRTHKASASQASGGSTGHVGTHHTSPPF